MTCADVRARLADRLDGLLEEADAAAVDAHLAACAPCTEEAARAGRRRARLLRAWDVPGPAPDLPERLLARAARRGRPWVGPAVRHALTFAAGLAAGVLLLRDGGATAPPAPLPSVTEAAPVAPVAESLVLAPLPRRIR